jgi:hypothetical protein
VDCDASVAANLEWDKAGKIATFDDAPGFNGAPAGSSLYMGDAKGGAYYFGFKTFVKNRYTYEMLREIEWYMRIDVPVPGKGGRWWSFVK